MDNRISPLTQTVKYDVMGTMEYDLCNVLDGFCSEPIPGPVGIIIFGASGDLTHRKLLPSLYELYRKQYLRDRFYVLGCARTKLSESEFQKRVRDSLKEKAEYAGNGEKQLADFVRHCTYLSGDYTDPALYSELSAQLSLFDVRFDTDANHLFYLATPPSLYTEISCRLGASGLAQEKEKSGYAHIIFEKPFGHDLDSARDLDQQLRNVFREHQIYRIDHYLGKETVQNILMFRFANTIFEPIWNRSYIDHIQITVAESLGVEHRAGYYEHAGLLRDMFQNHMMQMLALVAMEPPASFQADRVRDERIKLLRSIQRFETARDVKEQIVRGQYSAGMIGGTQVPGYREEPGVAPNSMTETYVAARLLIDNWRWQGVPFYLRSGKRLGKKLSEIVIVFKNVPHSLFSPLKASDLAPNMLVFSVQPEEGIALKIQIKMPGPKLCMQPLFMNFRYKDHLKEEPPEAYQRLLLDCIVGDQTLFWRYDEVETAWAFWGPVLNVWEQERGTIPLEHYEAGTWGPGSSHVLLARENRSWHMP